MLGKAVDNAQTLSILQIPALMIMFRTHAFGKPLLRSFHVDLGRFRPKQERMRSATLSTKTRRKGDAISAQLSVSEKQRQKTPVFGRFSATISSPPQASRVLTSHSGDIRSV